MLRSLKKTGIRTPDGDDGFLGDRAEGGAGELAGSEFAGAAAGGAAVHLPADFARGLGRAVFPLAAAAHRHGKILRRGAAASRAQGQPDLPGNQPDWRGNQAARARRSQGTKVVADVCILYSHDNDWALQQPMQPNKHFNLREHIQLFYNGLHHRNMPVDFARPTEDLSKYKLVFAPSLHLLAGGEADLLKLYVQNGGTLVATFNTGLVDEHHIAPDTGYPHDLTDVFGLEVLEFDPLPPGEENHMTFKGPSRRAICIRRSIWCDIIEPKGCQVLATYAQGFLRGQAGHDDEHVRAGQGDLHRHDEPPAFLRRSGGLAAATGEPASPLLKVPDTVEVSMRQKDNTRIYFLLNHQNSPVRIQFYKPMHDFLTGGDDRGQLRFAAARRAGAGRSCGGCQGADDIRVLGPVNTT